MKIYVSEAVYSKQDDYVNFLVGISGYNRREAEIRRWEINQTMVIVTQEAINDVGTFYGNVAKRYPNT